MKISGTFDVKMEPLTYSGQPQEGIQIARMLLDKTFHGDLSATSKGEMLSAVTPVKGSAGYVVIEQTVGTLMGKKGSFILQHFGIMKRGEPRLILEVVPDSGTGELTGLSGTMEIVIPHAGELGYFRLGLVATPLKMRRYYQAWVQRLQGKDLWGKLTPRQIEHALLAALDAARALDAATGAQQLLGVPELNSSYSPHGCDNTLGFAHPCFHELLSVQAKLPVRIGVRVEERISRTWIGDAVIEPVEVINMLHSGVPRTFFLVRGTQQQPVGEIVCRLEWDGPKTSPAKILRKLAAA